jgi:hypothetical protein
VTGQRQQAPIAKAAGDAGRLRECRVACSRVTLHDAFNGSGNQETSAHDALELSLVEYTFGSGEPPSSRRHRAAPYQSNPAQKAARAAAS